MVRLLDRNYIVELVYVNERTGRGRIKFLSGTYLTVPLDLLDCADAPPESHLTEERVGAGAQADPQAV